MSVYFKKDFNYGRLSMTKPAPQLVSLILDSITEGVFTVDDNLRINFFNQAAQNITGFTQEQALGKHCFEIFHSSLCRSKCALRKTLDTGKTFTDVEVEISNRKGEKIPISVSTSILRDTEGYVVGAVETFRDLSALKALRNQLEDSHSFENIVSKNYRMKEIFRILPDVAKSDATVLIQGPSGCGKEVMVRALHNLSNRKDAPFVKVNCGALPDTLLESELFGYVKGAFTDAKKDKSGRFTLAEGGTIFLDEIGDISPALQVKLLRVLQEREFEPLGSTKTHTANVRVVAATNRDLKKLVEEGVYRNDLYYRIKVMEIEIPSLANRREDIPILIDHFVKKQNQKMDKNLQGVSDEVLEILMAHSYPGNVRELENIIEHGFILCKNDQIELRHLPQELKQNSEEIETGDLSTCDPLKYAEAKTILSLLKQNGGNRIKTATDLGIDRTTLWRKMKNYGIETQHIYA